MYVPNAHNIQYFIKNAGTGIFERVFFYSVVILGDSGASP
jgi:hypothetical protein